MGKQDDALRLIRSAKFAGVSRYALQLLHGIPDSVLDALIADGKVKVRIERFVVPRGLEEPWLYID